MNIEFEQSKNKIIGIRFTDKEVKEIKEVCDKLNINTSNLIRSLFKTYYKEFKENETKENKRK